MFTYLESARLLQRLKTHAGLDESGRRSLLAEMIAGLHHYTRLTAVHATDDVMTWAV